MSPVYKFSNAGGFTSKQRYTSMLADNTRFVLASFESIATVTVGSGGSSEINFTSIPATFTHLQVRIIARTASVATSDGLLMRVGTSGSIDTTSTLWGHNLMGNGSSATSGSRSSTNIELVQTTAASSTSGIFGVAVIDILDYANTNKAKTFRSLTGHDQNGSGQVRLMSGSYGANTNAITDLRFFSAFSNVAQYSQFALYGIRSI
jgi:hypothetical protein